MKVFMPIRLPFSRVNESNFTERTSLQSPSRYGKRLGRESARNAAARYTANRQCGRNEKPVLRKSGGGEDQAKGTVAIRRKLFEKWKTE